MDLKSIKQAFCISGLYLGSYSEPGTVETGCISRVTCFRTDKAYHS